MWILIRWASPISVNWDDEWKKWRQYNGMQTYIVSIVVGYSRERKKTGVQWSLDMHVHAYEKKGCE